MIDRPLNKLFLVLLWLMLSACAPDEPAEPGAPGETGSLTFDIDWSQALNPALENGQARKITLSSLPSDVAQVRISISGDFTTITRTFDYAERGGILPGVPVGSNRSVSVQGLNSSGGTRYQGSITGVSIDRNQTTQAGTVVMQSVDTTVPVIVTGDYTNSLGMSFNLLPAGSFTMGSPTDELGRYSDETQHQVTLTQSFYMQTTEVTQSQWRAVMGTDPSSFTACGDDCPVERVSWDDVQQFLLTINSLGEGTYSLPTEAQWEYACRAGTTTAFANGDITSSTGVDPNLEQMGWYTENSGSTTHPVAQKDPNDWGLYDMHGNVYEWTADWYGSYGGDATDPTGAASGSYRVVRGGSWGSVAQFARCALRNYGSPDYSGYIGFRLSRTP